MMLLNGDADGIARCIAAARLPGNKQSHYGTKRESICSSAWKPAPATGDGVDLAEQNREALLALLDKG
jgi:hypothetical protein